MIIGLDSAIPPSPAQAQAARAAGIRLWNGYLSEIPGRDGLYRPWSLSEFQVVKAINPRPVAFTSGWDEPVGAKAMANQWGVRLCLDVERLIRDDGPWVQPWLDASGAGLYGVRSVHTGRRAAFHIAAWYPGANPSAAYPAGWDGAGAHGWQWQNTHNEFGVGVDRGWYDDWFLSANAGANAGGEVRVQEDDLTPEEHGVLMAMSANVARLYYVLGLEPSAPSPNSKSDRLDRIEAELAALKTGAPPAGWNIDITPK